MRRLSFSLLVVFTAALLFSPLPLSAAPTRQDSSGGYVPNELIVRLAPGVNLLSLLAVLPLKLRVIDQLGSLPIVRLRILNGVDPLDLASRLIASRLVLYAEPNYLGG